MNSGLDSCLLQRKIEYIEKETCLGTRCCREKEKLQHQLREADSERNRLWSQVRKLEAAAAAHAREHEAAKSAKQKFNDVEAELQQTKRNLASTAAVVAQLQRKLKTAEDQLQERDTLHHAAPETSGSAKDAVEPVNAALSKLQARFESAKQELAAVQMETKAAQEENARLQELLQNAHKNEVG
jgi:chromosome segregation ATPase